MRAASRVGPNTVSPRACSSSARPATSGASGPTTVRSIDSRSAKSARPGTSAAAMATGVASSAIPALPGAAYIRSMARFLASPHTSACSRPPPPTTRTLTAFPSRRRQGLGAGGPDRHGSHGDPSQIGDPVDVGPRRRGQVPEGGTAVDLLSPPLRLLVHGLCPVEGRLVERHVLDPLPVHLIRHADLDRGESRQHVELRQEELGEAVDASRVAKEHRVEPPASPAPARRRAELVPPPHQCLADLAALLAREGAR